MQIDARSSYTSYPAHCPVCGQPLNRDSNTCPSCGFTGPAFADTTERRPALNKLKRARPGTPIPARASARRGQSGPGGAPFRRERGTGMDAYQARRDESRRHRSSHYEVRSSLSALSLIISEVPTVPPRSTRRLDPIDEIDTVSPPSGRERTVRVPDGASPVPAIKIESPETPLPPALAAVPNLAQITSETTFSGQFPLEEIDTIPEVHQTPPGVVVPVPPLPLAPPQDATEATAWTATHISAGASPLSSLSWRGHARSFNPLDRTRWWLLRPGHIEFLLWTLGSLLLFLITFFLLLATILSIMLPGWRTGR